MRQNDIEETRLKIKELKKCNNKKKMYTTMSIASRVMTSLLAIFSGFSIGQAMRGNPFYGIPAVNYELAGLSIFNILLLLLAAEPYCDIKSDIYRNRANKLSDEIESSKEKSI